MKFYTTSQNTRNKEIGTGNHKGQSVHTRTWSHGVRVISKETSSGEIVFQIYGTSGTNGASDDFYVGEIRLQSKTDKPIFFK